MRRLQEQARASGFPVHDGISDLDTLGTMILADLLAALHLQPRLHEHLDHFDIFEITDVGNGDL